ncbi:MAG TPA: GNAT family N-acetyltransferase [Solirubrobacteraceae bacterium]
MPEREVLRDAGGRPVATYVHVDRRSGPMADLVVPAAGVERADVVAALFAQRPGWLAGTEDRALGDALIRAGAQLRRSAHVYSRDLRAGPPVPESPAPPGVVMAPLEAVDDDLAAACAAAYGADHPDHRPHAGPDALEALVAGEVVGHLMHASRAAWRDGRQVGAVVITDSPHDPPEGGPWIGELFRAPDPRLAGLGAALLAAALHAARDDGLATLGLVVSDGNPARALYERFGFRHLASACTVWLSP